MEISLHFLEKGSGPPLILLHGNGESSDYFAKQVDDFSRFRRVIAVDTRGHGRSPRGTGPMTLSRFAGDLHTLLARLGIERPAILGFSDGGNTALLYALKHPVSHLILNGANLRPWGLCPGVLLSVFLDWCRAAVARPFCKQAAARLELSALMLFEPRIRAASLSGISCPALVIAGTRDMIRRRHTEKIARSLPRGTLAFIEGSHFIAAENSAPFNEAVRQFLNEV